jgi:hypothetical protein
VCFAAYIRARPQNSPEEDPIHARIPQPIPGPCVFRFSQFSSACMFLFVVFFFFRSSSCGFVQ